MKRIFDSLNRRASSVSSKSSSNATYSDDSPEGAILREVAAFCESGRANDAQSSDYIHLPAIVESAESSPNAAKEAAHRLRKFLGDTANPGHIHYNSIMLIRILIDNPGHTFARNLDAKFASSVKDLLRQGRDMGVQQFLRETLEFMENQRSWDEDLAPLVQMWGKEKTRNQKVHSMLNSRPRPSRNNSQNFYGSPRSVTPGSTRTARLPLPDELAAQIAEAKNSAKLLQQFVQSTPPAEVLENDLMEEFSHRCRTAANAIQSYIHSTNPAPDEDTLLTLIETNDELSVSLSKHQHAILNARKALGSASNQSPAASSGEVPMPGASGPAPPLPQRDVPGQSPFPEVVPAPVHAPAFAPAPAPAPVLAPLPVPTGGPPGGTGINDETGRYEYRSEDFQVQNPFADNNLSTMGHTGGQQPAAAGTNGWYQQSAERTS